MQSEADLTTAENVAFAVGMNLYKFWKAKHGVKVDRDLVMTAFPEVGDDPNSAIYWGDYVFLQNNRIENQWLSGARGSSPNNGVVTGDVKNKESHAENRSKWKIMSD